MANNPTSLNTPYLFLTGTVLVAIVSLFTLLQPMMDDVNTIRQTITADTQTLKDRQDFFSSLDAKTKQLQTLAGVESQMATILPETERPQDAIRVLHEYAAQSGVVVDSISNTSSTSGAQANAAIARGDGTALPASLNILSFKLNMGGSYEQVRLFLTLLGKSPRVVDVTEVAFKQAPAEPGRITADITIQLYSQQTSQPSGE